MNDINRLIEAKHDEMKSLIAKYGDDHEAIHYEADRILVDIIGLLGHCEIADTFDSFTKWYA
jgi:hypothetical protein